mgnify:FL=1
MFFHTLPKLYVGDKMNLIWYLLFYSFLGFCAEVVFARVTHSGKQNRKCLLFLPLCPVYGIGAAAIVSLPQAIASHPLLLFFVSAVIASAAEYGMSLFYERVWGVSFWNYANLPGNFHGRICPAFSLIWGGLGLALTYLIHPIIAGIAARFPPFLAIPALLLFIIDFTLTTVLLRESHNTDDLIWYR